MLTDQHPVSAAGNHRAPVIASWPAVRPRIPSGPSSWGHSSGVSCLSSLTGGSPGSRGGCSCLWARVRGSCPPRGQPHQPLGTPTASAGPSRSLARWPQPWELCPPPTPGALSPPGFLQESLLLVLGYVQMSPDCEPPRGETLGSNIVSLEPVVREKGSKDRCRSRKGCALGGVRQGLRGHGKGLAMGPGTVLTPMCTSVRL